MKHKLFAIVISLALIVTMELPGTLAIAADQDRSTEESAPAVEPPVTEEISAGDVAPAPVVTPVECNCGTETDVHNETCPLYVAPVSDGAPVECTCGAEADVHSDGCPLYVTPVPTDPVKECICNTESDLHAEDCPLCVTQVAEPSLFERLMVCKTLEELFIIVDETPQEALLALTEEENAQIEAKIAQMEPEPLPPVVIEETSDVPVVSEIIYPTVNFDNVAPFGAPVEG